MDPAAEAHARCPAGRTAARLRWLAKRRFERWFLPLPIARAEAARLAAEGSLPTRSRS